MKIRLVLLFLLSLVFSTQIYAWQWKLFQFAKSAVIGKAVDKGIDMYQKDLERLQKQPGTHRHTTHDASNGNRKRKSTYKRVNPVCNWNTGSNDCR